MRSVTISWILGVIVLIIGAANLLLIHPVPGIIGLSLSLLFFPPVNDFFKAKLGFRVPLAVKMILGLAITWFTLAISDLGEMIV